MSLFKPFVPLSLLTALLLGPATTQAQVKTIEPTQESGKPDQPTIYQMTVSAAPEPRPALQYHFLVPPVDQIHGNAALFYYKAMGFEGPDEIGALYKLTNDDETDHLLFEAPLDQLPQDKAAKVTDWLRNDNDYKLWLVKGAQCDYAAWEDSIREEGMFALLPHIQKSRGLARAIALRARLFMAQGKIAEALQMLQLNYGLAHQIGNGTSLVQCLVGLAIEGISHEQTRTFIALSNSPNLYWALTDLSAQPISLREAMSYESKFWDFTIHELADLDHRALTPDEALNVAVRLLETERTFSSHKFSSTISDTDKAEILGLAMALYPQARSYLLDHGYKPEQIDAMPVVQTVLLLWWKQFEIVRDDAFKWLTLPDSEVPSNLAQMQSSVREKIAHGEGGVFANSLPVLQATVGAHFRRQRATNLLRTVEALRMYAADHGRWPETLDEIKQVPVPLDPWTQKPFDYSVKDGVAVLEAPRTPKAPWPIDADERYELTLRPAAAK
jgi:hypothetical protein